jgi:hypothetical protein
MDDDAAKERFKLEDEQCSCWELERIKENARTLAVFIDAGWHPEEGGYRQAKTAIQPIIDKAMGVGG